MNYGNFHFDDTVSKKLTDLLSQSRLPHSVLITGGNSRYREAVSNYLCSFAVCKSANKPCFQCFGCRKVLAAAHPDIEFVEGDRDSKKHIYSKKVLDNLQERIGIMPNEADKKVYIFSDVDEKLPPISQNALLKTLEEPPQDILFILTCKSAGSLLETVLSRCTEISIPVKEEFTDKSVAIAREIALAIIDINEYNLLTATYKLNDRKTAAEVFLPLRSIIRECLVLAVGGEVGDDIPAKLIRKLTREKILGLLNTLNSAQQKLDSNVNINLLCTWLCTEFRRITWQK
ncbi:MAG: hypothetical protein IJV39_03170 [Ruminococcus sp.]|nr:hypothetical protein [Ruminococcus sp.]